MVLEDLHELVETLQGRIAEHGAALQQSETLTRYALIDPLLRGLGWDTGDPSQVLPEYRSAAGSADYALLGLSGSPQVMVEAKKLGTHLDVKVRQQVTSYCQEEGVPFAVITDGRRWEIYDIFQPAAMKDSLVATLDLGHDPAATSLRSLALWRRSVVAGTVVSAATPLLDVAPPVEKAPTNTTDLNELFPASTPAADPGLWHILTDFIPESGTKPGAIRFPDNTVVSTPNWADFIGEVVRWLKAHGDLTDSDLPIQVTSGATILVGLSPTHKTGKQFKTLRKVDTWFVNANYASADHVQNARSVIQLAKSNPAAFAVRLQ
ncbi:MAG: hypothetical protein F4Y11_06215 [Chloroflexi bacterium]|nr:hypothetical protein [Chloroflexota bacterium]